ncbi:hypothetical protein CALVIDRAFT_542529, partial [Calocera viscosa TUFC12733]
MIGYLGYTFVQAATSVPKNWYQLLGADVGVEKEGLQKAFRRFAVKYHPDRAGKEGEDIFVRVRAGYEALQSPEKRFAYERFGDDMIRWATENRVETLVIGLKRSVGFYIVATILMGVVKLNSGGKDVMLLWRGFVIVACAALEFFVVLHPIPAPLQYVFSNTLPFQYVDWLHQVSMSISAGLGHIAPIWKAKEVEDSALLPDAMRMVGMLDNEVMSMIHTDLRELQAGWAPAPEPLNNKEHSPLHSTLHRLDAGMLTSLETSMIISVLENRLRAHPELKELWDAIVARVAQEPEPLANGRPVTPVLEPAMIPLPESPEISRVMSDSSLPPSSPARHSPMPSSPMPGLSRTISSSHLPSPEPE